jgi:drug/metabolite transporter (DMT)-like permease
MSLTRGRTIRSPISFLAVVALLYQMLILKTKLTRGQWGGIAIVIVALAMVGASSALRTKYSPGGADPSTDGATSGQALAGIILILLGSLFNSIQGARMATKRRIANSR